MTPAYVAVAILVLAVVAGLALVRRGDRAALLRPLAGLSMGFVIAGLVFGSDERVLGYALMGVGVILAVVDVVRHGRAGEGSR